MHFFSTDVPYDAIKDSFLHIEDYKIHNAVEVRHNIYFTFPCIQLFASRIFMCWVGISLTKCGNEVTKVSRWCLFLRSFCPLAHRGSGMQINIYI
jgi:hypothetical protein